MFLKYVINKSCYLDKYKLIYINNKLKHPFKRFHDQPIVHQSKHIYSSLLRK